MKEIECLEESQKQSLAVIEKIDKQINEQQETKHDEIESSRKQTILRELKAYCPGVVRIINLATKY